MIKIFLLIRILIQQISQNFKIKIEMKKYKEALIEVLAWILCVVIFIAIYKIIKLI